MGGLDGLAAVQARIAAIQSQFASPGVGVLGSGTTSGGSGSASTSAAGGDFASLLSGLGSDASGATATDTAATATDGTGATPAAIPANGDMRSRAAHEQFAKDLLARIGAPATSDNVRALVAWQMAEGTRAAFNPLATVRSSHQGGETKFNS